MMGVVTNVVASFVAAHGTFERIQDQQPFDQYIISILKVIVSIVYVLRWNVENGMHSIVELLLTDAPHVAKYKALFPWPISRPGIYSATLDTADKDVVHTKGRATHTTK
jgi:hypothetical protein